MHRPSDEYTPDFNQIDNVRYEVVLQGGVWLIYQGVLLFSMWMLCDEKILLLSMIISSTAGCVISSTHFILLSSASIIFGHYVCMLVNIDYTDIEFYLPIRTLYIVLLRSKLLFLVYINGKDQRDRIYEVEYILSRISSQHHIIIIESSINIQPSYR